VKPSRRKYSSEQIAQVRALWDAGPSASQIAATLNETWPRTLNKNHVIGIAHRNGFPDRDKAIQARHDRPEHVARLRRLWDDEAPIAVLLNALAESWGQAVTRAHLHRFLRRHAFPKRSEAVQRKLRSEAARRARGATATHCCRGHAMVAENVAVYPVKGRTMPLRTCKACSALRSKAWRAAQKAAE
jgi:hypothetical protein